jgi:FAD/FMN-containing dehydrogenase
MATPVLKDPITVPEHAVARLREQLSGPLLRPGDDDYDRARIVWNRLIDRRPALIARCAGVEDVVTALRFAREHELVPSVRGGGHNVAGSAVGDGGIMIDLSAMKQARVDASTRTIVAGPGLTWGAFDAATHRFGLATTAGIVSSTGVAGLTLGGGHGWLMRGYGLSCDNLRSVDVVTADGRCVRASAEENPDLFWGVRGGGGNFGIVTAFEFELHPVTTVVAGLLLYPMTRAREVLEVYREVARKAPDALVIHVIITVWTDGTPVIALVLCYSDAAAMAERVLQPLRRLRGPLLDTVRAVPYVELQTSFDATNPPGHWYYKSGYFAGGALENDRAIDVLLDHCEFPTPSILSRVVIEGLGGAMGRVDPDATAFVHRNAPFDLIVIAGGFERQDAPKNLAWARQTWSAMHEFLSGGIYVNYLDGDQGAEGVRAAYGPAYQRLAALKRTYDPENVFRLNHNIRPV